MLEYEQIKDELRKLKKSSDFELGDLRDQIYNYALPGHLIYVNGSVNISTNVTVDIPATYYTASNGHYSIGVGV